MAAILPPLRDCIRPPLRALFVGINPGIRSSQTGHHFDDTRRYIDALGLAPGVRAQVYELNARRVYPRLDAKLAAAGR